MTSAATPPPGLPPAGAWSTTPSPPTASAWVTAPLPLAATTAASPTQATMPLPPPTGAQVFPPHAGTQVVPPLPPPAGAGPAPLRAMPPLPGRPTSIPAQRPTGAPAQHPTGVPAQHPTGAPAQRPAAHPRPAGTATGQLLPPMPALGAPRRVTVVGETGRIDLALPAQSTVAELIPVLARAIAVPGDPRAYPGGLELCRAGGAALPGERTVAALGLRDGELLHLVAAGHGTAAAIFDDVVDAVASNVSDAPGRWRPALSRRVALLVAVPAFGGAALVAVATAAWPAGPIAAVLMAALLLAAGVAVTRVRLAAAVGAALAGAGMPCLVAASLGLAGTPFGAGTARWLVAAFGAVAAYALLGAMLLPAYRIWFSTAVGTALAGAVAVAVVAAGHVAPAGAAAVLVVLAVVLSPAFPILSLRLGGLPVPEVPTDMAAFRATETPTPAPVVAGRAAAAETALTSLLVAEALVVVAGGAVLLRVGGTAGWILTGVAGLALLVRSRAYLSVAQRAALLCAGFAALVATALTVVLHGGSAAPPVVGALALLAGTACAAHAVRAGRRPPSPYWARFLDVVDFIVITALVPAGAAVLGLYGSIQALAG